MNDWYALDSRAQAHVEGRVPKVSVTDLKMREFVIDVTTGRLLSEAIRSTDSQRQR